jgi:hypothetical protein
VHLQHLDFNFLFYNLCLLIIIYNALNSKKGQIIQYKGLAGPQRSIALSEVYALTRKWLRLTGSSEKGWAKNGWVRQLSKKITTPGKKKHAVKSSFHNL